MNSSFNSNLLNQSNNNKLLDLNQPRKTKHITDEEKQREQKRSKEFQQQIKNEMPSLERPPGACLLNKVRYQDDSMSSLRVLVFRGNLADDNYPYKNTRDFMGVVYE